MKLPEFNINEAMRKHPPAMEFKVTGVRWFHFRLRLGAAFVRLGVRIMGGKFK